MAGATALATAAEAGAAIISETDSLACGATMHGGKSVDDDNVTSNATATERCNSIGKLLEQLHRKWWPQQRASANDAGHATQQSWALEDSYNLTAFNQFNGVWPLGHPLPLPDWEPYEEQSKGVLHFDSVWQYEDVNAIIEMKLQRMLEETPYDTVHNFIDFFKSFKRTRRSDLKSFYQFYDIPINRRDHMCVSLAMELIARIIEIFPVMQHYMYIVSCEEHLEISTGELIEWIDEAGGLTSPDAKLEKEHCMVAMKISIAGREGVMLLDPGYHVAHAVTVMSDLTYPHTGWFTQSKEPHLQRDYCYNYSRESPKYVEWLEREIRGDEPIYRSSVVYIDQPYLTAIDVTVRRNLVYNFRSLLTRDAKGRVYAGIYFPVQPNCNEAHFTIFYDGPTEDQRVKAKFMFNAFKNPTKIPDNLQQHLEKLAPQLKMSITELTELFKSLTKVVTDQDFITQILTINDEINEMATDGATD